MRCFLVFSVNTSLLTNLLLTVLYVTICMYLYKIHFCLCVCICKHTVSVYWYVGEENGRKMQRRKVRLLFVIVFMYYFYISFVIFSFSN